MRAFVRLIDTLLSKSLRIYEFTDDPECILRIQLTRATHTTNFSDERILKGEPLLELHVWNKRMPQLPEGGATLEWALHLHRQLINSFKGVAHVIQTDERFSQVRAVCGTSALFSFSGHTGGTHLMQHLGFTILPYHRPFGRFGEFWENLFSWWLLWAYNDVSMQSREFFRLQRTEIWISTLEFMRRYGDITLR